MTTNYIDSEFITDKDNFLLSFDKDIYCCVCFSNNVLISKKSPTEINQPNEYLSLSDIEPYFFTNNIIPDDLLIKSCCNIHYICIKCLRLIVNNYENHPINENNSHLSCPYPFKDCVTEIGFKNIFDHNLIRKILKTEKEWNNYISHAERFSFPGYTIIKCPMYTRYGLLCNTNILIENEFIKNKQIGDVIIHCDQNEKCLRKFCFNCKQNIKYYDNECFDCKTIYENENPNIFNYYLNKNASYSNQIINYNDESDLESELDYDESSYLFLNKEITEEIAIDQIISLLIDENSYIICPICKNSLYKTERCNGLSHHNLERCYSCGRIGFISKGLIEHWNNRGIEGCFRFDHDAFVKKYIPTYQCTESLCSNHDKGDCQISEHQDGIKHIYFIRKSAYIYHILKSLLPNIRITVYDKLYKKLLISYPELLDYLPYKQTLILLDKYKKRYKDYTEDIFYEQLKCISPKNISHFILDKSYYISSDQYITEYTIYSNSNNDINNDVNLSIISPQNNIVSNWRNILYTDTYQSTDNTEIINFLDNLIDNIQPPQNIHIETHNNEINNILQNNLDNQLIETTNSNTNSNSNTNTNSNFNNLELPAITLNSYSLLINLDDNLSDLSDVSEEN